MTKLIITKHIESEYNNVNLPEIIKNNGMLAMLEALDKHFSSLPADVETKCGRAEIRSNGAEIGKIRQSLNRSFKAAVDVEEQKVKTARNARLLCDKRLGNLRKFLAEPLERYEAEQARRTTAIKNMLYDIKSDQKKIELNWQTIDKHVITSHINDWNNNQSNWMEYEKEAKEALAEAIEAATNCLKNREIYDEQEAKLLKLRLENEKIEREKEQIEQKKNALETKVRADEESRIAEIERVKKEKREAIEELERKRRQKQEKIEQEHQNIKVARDAKRRQEEASKALEERKATVQASIVDGIMKELGIDEEMAKVLFRAIERGDISHLKIVY